MLRSVNQTFMLNTGGMQAQKIRILREHDAALLNG